MAHPDRSAEAAFIRACLTHRLYPDRALPWWSDGLDGDRLHALLARHWLNGSFYVLGKAHPDLWPQSLQERLRRDYYSALLWGDHCAEEVSALLAALREADVPVIVLKGWALIPTVYQGDYGRRTYADIDLFVSPAQLTRAEGILHHLGYLATPEVWRGYCRRYRNCRAYQRPRDPAPFSRLFAVGLHWHLLQLPFFFGRITAEPLFERARPLQVAGVDVRALTPEDRLVYACGHLALHHRYDQALFRYHEMAAGILAAGTSFDWQAVLARAGEWRLVRPVERVLRYLDRLWPGIVPASVLATCLGLQVGLLERWVHDVVTRGTPTVRTAALLLTTPGVLRRLRYLLETAFPGPAYMTQRYCPESPQLWPLAYLQRVSLALRYLFPPRGRTRH